MFTINRIKKNNGWPRKKGIRTCIKYYKGDFFLKRPILKILNRQYESLSFIECILKRYDLAFKTDEKGNPFLLFMLGH